MTEEMTIKYLSAMRIIDFNKLGFVYGKEIITDVLNLIEKKDKIIDEMAETILEDTLKLDTYWCNGCFKIAECPYKNPKECIKQYFERKVEV